MTIIERAREKYLEKKADKYIMAAGSYTIYDRYFHLLDSINNLSDTEYNSVDKKYLRTYILFKLFKLYADSPENFNLFKNDEKTKASILDLINKNLLYNSSVLSCIFLTISIPFDLLTANNFIHNMFKTTTDQYVILSILFAKITTVEEANTLLTELPKILDCQPDKFKISNGKTILHIAASNNPRVKIATTNNAKEILLDNMLLKYPELINIKDNDGKNSGCYADNKRSFAILKILVKHGLNLNELDNFGNSVLHHVVDSMDNDYKLTYEMQKDLEYILHLGAKDQKKHQQNKTSLHLRVAAGLPLNLDTLKVSIDKQDLDEGKTALHHAISLAKTESAMELIAAGASINIKDKFGKTPLDYAFLTNNEIVIKSMIEKNNLIQTEKQPLLFNIYALFKTYYDGYNALNLINKHSASNKIILSRMNMAITQIINMGNLDPTLLAKFSLEEQLMIAITVAISNPTLNNPAKEYTKTTILPKLINDFPLPAGYAYGVELELANIPLEIHAMILKWFGINSTEDESVRHTLFMHKGKLKGEELVTEILDSTQKIKLLLLVASYLHKAGALTNDSTGLHVHVNILGSKNGIPKSIATNMDIKNINHERVELMVVKQVLANWYNLEPLLCGIMRDGILYNYDDNTYSYNAPMQSFIPELLKVNNLQEIADFMDDRDKTLNLENLAPGEYGTLEFRIHDGTAHPVLIEAWLNFIHRLMQISINQVQDKINTGIDINFFTAYKDIEQLFYILMAERNYQTTWNNALGSPNGTIAPATAGNKPIQIGIQNSLLYRAYQLGKSGKDYKILLASCSEPERASLQKEVEILLSINQQFPGILSKPIIFLNKIRPSAKL